MIKLYTFPEAFGLRNVSPFCLKVEMALEHLGLDYEIVMESDPRKSPKGKLPYIVDEGLTIADSELVLEHLDTKLDGRLYGDVSDQEHATGLAFTRLIEDHLYWMVVASRWLDDDWFHNVREGFFSNLPPVIKTVVAWVARKQVVKTYQLHGLGNHTLEEQAGFARRDFESLSRALKTGQYICGDRLTVYDFSVASLLAGLYDQKPPTWINSIADDFPEVRAYAERVQNDVGVYAAR
jgi:glutathione S-transferase